MKVYDINPAGQIPGYSLRLGWPSPERPHAVAHQASTALVITHSGEQPHHMNLAEITSVNSWRA